MSTTLLVADFDDEVRDRDLRRLFSRYGTVQSATVCLDSRTGESCGYGFVTMHHDSEARNAVHFLYNHRWRGRPLKIAFTR